MMTQWEGSRQELAATIRCCNCVWEDASGKTHDDLEREHRDPSHVSPRPRVHLRDVYGDPLRRFKPADRGWSPARRYRAPTLGRGWLRSTSRKALCAVTRELASPPFDLYQEAFIEPNRRIISASSFGGWPGQQRTASRTGITISQDMCGYCGFGRAGPAASRSVRPRGMSARKHLTLLNVHESAPAYRVPAMPERPDEQFLFVRQVRCRRHAALNRRTCPGL